LQIKHPRLQLKFFSSQEKKKKKKERKISNFVENDECVREE